MVRAAAQEEQVVRRMKRISLPEAWASFVLLFPDAKLGASVIISGGHKTPAMWWADGNKCVAARTRDELDDLGDDPARMQTFIDLLGVPTLGYYGPPRVVTWEPKYFRHLDWLKKHR